MRAKKVESKKEEKAEKAEKAEKVEKVENVEKTESKKATEKKGKEDKKTIPEKKVKLEKEKKIEAQTVNTEEIDKAIKNIKPIFEQYNATSKEHGMKKEELNAEIDSKKDVIDAKKDLKLLKSNKIIKKYKGKYYLDETVDQTKAKVNKKHNKGKIIAIIVAVMIVLAGIGTAITLVVIDENNHMTIADGTISFRINKEWTAYTSSYTSGWNFYNYLGRTKIDENATEETEIDYPEYPAYVNIAYYEVDKEKLTSIEDVKTSMKEYTESLDAKPDTYEDSIITSKNGYGLLTIKMTYSEEPSQTEYLYYIMNGEKLACIDMYSFNKNDDTQLAKQGKELANSLKWVE